MNCPDELQWSALLDGNLTPREFDNVSKHILGCADCQTTFHDLQAQDELLIEMLRPACDTDAMTRAILDRWRNDQT